MTITVDKKEYNFQYLTEDDIENFNEQLSEFEEDHGRLSLDVFYNCYVYIESFKDRNGYTPQIWIRDLEEDDLLLLEYYSESISDKKKSVEIEYEMRAYLKIKLLDKELKELLF